MLKNYIGISRDHSGSMGHIAHAAAKDYNQTVEALKQTSLAEGIETIFSVVRCGDGRYSRVTREIVNQNIYTTPILPAGQYIAQAPGTPLFDSIGELINIFEASPDINNKEVSFLIMAITDGEENDSKKWSRTLINKIKQLQSTDRWTFVFRVPRGYKNSLVGLGIHEGNILEWDQSSKGVEQSTVTTSQAFSNFYAGRKTGQTSTRSFYTTNLTEVDINQIKANLIDVSNQVTFWDITVDYDGFQIRDFCEHMTGQKMLKGAAFYRLDKKEREVQDHKQIALRNKDTGAVYIGPAARDLLGLPHYGMISLAPGDNGDYDIFVQSTSVNRKCSVGSEIMYWPNLGVAYHEGKSA
jgi:hypothetical protein